MLLKQYTLAVIMCLCGLSALSQTDVRPFIEKGNSFYNKEDFRNAAVQYKHACQLDSLSFDSWYNFGNALYKLNKYILAGEAYDKALKLTSDKEQKAAILHNVGNITCEQGKYEEAVKLYKQSLILNPNNHLNNLHKVKNNHNVDIYVLNMLVPAFVNLLHYPVFAYYHYQTLHYY